MLFAEQSAAVFFQTAYKPTGRPSHTFGVIAMSVFFFNIILFIGISSLVSLVALWWYEHNL